MNTYFNQPDGETFVDVQQKTILPAEMWHGLSVNQLIDTKNELTTRSYQYQDKPEMLKPLLAGIQRLETLIAHRLTTD